MVNSMTGYAAKEAAAGGLARSWELRSVNARGLDIRLRLPEAAAGLEAALRARLGAAVRRGNVTLSLRLGAKTANGAPRLDPQALALAAEAAHAAERALEAAGAQVTPSAGADLLRLPGVFEVAEAESRLPDPDALLAEFEDVLAEFLTMRADEGAALTTILSGQLEAMEARVAAASGLANARDTARAARFQADVARLVDAAGGAVDPDKLSQDLASLIVKGDVTEEIDRLSAHIAQARKLIAADGPVGRKLDFLMQEFNREANTLCSKSNDTALTQAGLDLKVTIDQMREQVQNLE